MPDEPATYLQSCSLKPDQATRVSRMIASHTEFLGIGIAINPDRETYHPLLAQRIPQGEVLVTFVIPSEGVCMYEFYREFSIALNQEPTVAIQKEREG